MENNFTQNLAAELNTSKNNSFLFKIISNINNKEYCTTNKAINKFILYYLGNCMKPKDVYSDDLYFYKDILSSTFFDIDEKEALKNLYIKSKKIKNSLLYFLRLCRWKKAVKYSMNTDLYLNSLDDFPDSQKITLMENNTKYPFRLSDLVNCLTVCLTNSSSLFSKPLRLKNPHTNIEFSIHNLYNIYFKLLDSKFNIPLCIRGFFQCEMLTSKFLYKYFTILKEKTISNFSKSDNLYEKFEQLLNMFYAYREDIDFLTIVNHPPHYIKISLCKKLHDPLFYYLKSKYSCNPLIRKEFKIKTKTCLVKYLNKNPNFGLSRGREIIRFIPSEDRSSPISLPPTPSNQNRLGPPPIRAPPPPPPGPPPLLSQSGTPELQEIVRSLVRLPPINPPIDPPIQLSVNDISTFTQRIISRGLNENQYTNQNNIINQQRRRQPNILMTNPFSPNNELPRSPESLSNSINTIASSLNLFRR